MRAVSGPAMAGAEEGGQWRSLQQAGHKRPPGPWQGSVEKSQLLRPRSQSQSREVARAVTQESCHPVCSVQINRRRPQCRQPVCLPGSSPFWDRAGLLSVACEGTCLSNVTEFQGSMSGQAHHRHPQTVWPMSHGHSPGLPTAHNSAKEMS